MTARITRRAALAAILTPALARAHEGEHAMAVEVLADPAARGEDGVVRFAMTLVNGTPHALTLRGLACPEAASARLMRRRSLFGVEVWTEVGLVRLDPGEELRFARPDYVVEIAGAPAEEQILTLTLDFGPAGQRAVVVFVTR